MKEQQLSRLSRGELLEMLVVQQKEIERLQAALEERDARLAERELRFSKIGSIASAAVAVTSLFEEAQKAADLYLENARRRADEMALTGDFGGETADEENS